MKVAPRNVVSRLFFGVCYSPSLQGVVNVSQ